MIKIRAERGADQAAIYEVNRLAFGRDGEPRFVDAIRLSEHYVPGLSIVAVEAGEVIGHILFTKQVIQGSGKSVKALMLAPVAVKPGHQNKGIGSKLVAEGLKACKRMGFDAVIVVGHPTYYPKFGFGSARACGIEAPFPVPDEAFMALEIVPGALDGVRGTIVLAPEFALAM